MTDEEEQKIRDLITRGIEELKKDIAEMESSARPVFLGNPIGGLSRMDAMSNSMVTGETLRSLRTRLSKLECLSGRIDRPEFGMCTACSDPIAAKRLMAKRESNRCIHCADF